MLVTNNMASYYVFYVTMWFFIISLVGEIKVFDNLVYRHLQKQVYPRAFTTIF